MSEYTEETPSANNLVVRSEKRSKLWIITGFTVLITIETLYQYYICYEGILHVISGANVFNAEDAITNAVDYVTSSTLPVAYLLTGHGEPHFRKR